MTMHMGSNTKHRIATKATLVYLFLSLLPMGIKFFLLPIYVNFLTPADYGVLSLLSLFGALYFRISILQLNVVASVDFFKTEDKIIFEKRLLSLSIILGVCIFIFFVFLGPFLFEFFFTKIQISFFPSGIIVLSTNFLSAIHGLFFVFLRNKYSLRQLSFYSVLLVLISSISQYYFIVIEQLGYLGSLWGSLIASAVVFSIIIMRNVHLLSFAIDMGFVRRSLSVSLPMVVTLCLVWLQGAGDRFFLERYTSIEKVGLYALLATILGLALLLNKAYGMAIRPTLYQYMQDLELHAMAIKKTINQFVVLTIVSISGVILIGSNLTLITDQEKYLQIVPYFLLGALLMLPRMLIRIPRLQLIFDRKTNYITLYTTVSVVLMVLLIPILISFDIEGVLIAPWRRRAATTAA